MAERSHKDTIPVHINLPRKMLTLIDKRRKGRTQAAVIRELLAQALGKPELAEEIRMGRPKDQPKL